MPQQQHSHSMLSEASYHNMTVGRIPSVEGGIQPTIVDAKGDLIAAVAADSLNRLAVGSNDQVLVADSAASTGLAWKSYGAQVVAGKNTVINGGMDVWQRGTSIAIAASTSAGSSTFLADRWQTATGANQAITVSRQATGDTTNLPFIQYATRYQRNSGQTGTGDLRFVQSIESSNAITYAGRAVTLSFYARAGANYSAASSRLYATIISGTGTDQNVLGTYTGSSDLIGQYATLTTTWQRFSYTATIPATATEFANYFQFTPVGTAGTNDWFEITGVQVEQGSVATTFSRAGATIQGELAACQRYYIRYSYNSTNTQYFGSGIGFSTTRVFASLALPVSMRTTPSISLGGNVFVGDTNTNTQITSSGVNAGDSSGQQLSLSLLVASGLTQFRPYFIALTASGSLVELSSEL
jgi:hypothetical protein